MHIGTDCTDSLSGFQSNDDEDGSSVHASHTAAVAHKIIKDGGELSPNLKHKATRAKGQSTFLGPCTNITSNALLLLLLLV